MAEFDYTVRDRTGLVKTGRLEGASEQDALQQLSRMGYIVTSLVPRRGAGRMSLFQSLGQSRVSLKHLSLFTRQLASVLTAGLTLAAGLDALAKQAPTEGFRRVLNDVREEVSAGSSFSEALENHPNVFKPLYVSSVRSGESGGTLEMVLDRLAQTLERDLELTEQIKGAMYYPAAILVVFFMLIVVLTLFILPSFIDIFLTAGVDLPLLTRILIAVVQWGQRWALVVFAAMIVAVIALRPVFKTKKVRRYVDTALPRMPVIGNLVVQVMVARISRTLSMLISAGVPLMSALRLTAEVSSNTLASDALLDAAEGVQGGESLARALQRQNLFPPLLPHMTAVGEETGSVETMLSRLADLYEMEVGYTLKGLTSLIEPAIILVLGAGIGLVVASIFLPLVQMMQVL